MRLTLRTTPWLALVLLAALPAVGQPADPELPPAFGEIIDVRVINLEVVVTDGKERVRGLTSSDFRLLVDGEEVPIEYFTEVVGGQAVTPAAGAATVPALEPGEAVGTRFLVFIDEAFTIKTHRNRVLKRLVDQLPHLGPDDHMAVVAYDGRGLEMLTSWTSSQPALERVFEAAQSRRTYGLQRRIGPFYGSLPRSLFAAELAGPLIAPGPFDSGDRSAYYPYRAPRGSRAYSDVQRVLDAATTALRGFARPPGRKVMLLLSGSWPAVGGRDFTETVAYGGGFSGLRPLVDTANRLGYTLYPVDVAGLESHFGAGAQFDTPQQAAFFTGLSRDNEWLQEGTLVYLARETGGRAHIDGASRKALLRTVEDTRSYYWLGFTPGWQENDRRHRVKVEVLRKGLKVRSRDSFSDLSRQTEVSMLLESAQLFDLPLPGEGSGIVVTLGEPEKAGYRKVLVPLALEVPMAQVTVLPYQGGYVAELELRVAATDDKGNVARIPVIPIQLRGEAPDAPIGVFELGLKLRRRPHELLVSVHDPASGNILSQRVALEL